MGEFTASRAQIVTDTSTHACVACVAMTAAHEGFQQILTAPGYGD